MVLNSKDVTVFILSNFRIYAYTVDYPLHKSLIFKHPGSTFLKFFLKDLDIEYKFGKTICKKHFY